MVADERDADTGGRDRLRRAGADRAGRAACSRPSPPPRRTSGPDDPALVVFTSGTAGEPKPIRHGHGYLAGQAVQAEHWFGARPGDLCWCTAASGWSKSARNVFVAPWLRGAARAAPRRPLRSRRAPRAARARAAWTCSAWRPPSTGRSPSGPRLRRLPDLRHAVAAGEPLNPEVVHAWSASAGVEVHDGYGQTETGALTGMPIGPPVRPGSMGTRAARLPAVDRRGRALRGPRDRADLLPRRPARPALAHGRPRARGRGRLPLVRGPHRRRDHLRRATGSGRSRWSPRSSPTPRWPRPRPWRRPTRCAARWCARWWCCGTGAEPGDELARELQEHVRSETAPYKYPRIVEFAESLPKTASGKIKRAELRGSRAELRPTLAPPARVAGGARSRLPPWRSRCFLRRTGGSRNIGSSRVASDTWPTGWPARPRPTSSSTRTTPWTGTRGARRRSSARATEDRPILLSIGYSACHWCHVMERESFEDERDRRGS